MYVGPIDPPPPKYRNSVKPHQFDTMLTPPIAIISPSGDIAMARFVKDKVILINTLKIKVKVESGIVMMTV